MDRYNPNCHCQAYKLIILHQENFKIENIVKEISINAFLGHSILAISKNHGLNL